MLNKELAMEIVRACREYVGQQIGHVSNALEDLGKRIDALPTPKNGEPGERGASILLGEGPPLMAARSGDMYLDCKTGDIYRCD